MGLFTQHTFWFIPDLLAFSSHLISSSPWPRGLFGHHRWFRNQFPLFSQLTTALWDFANSRPVQSLMLSFHLFLCLVFFPLSLCLARWFWPVLMNGRHDHTTAVCVFLRWSGGFRVVWLPAGSWHGLPLWWHGLCMRCVVSCGGTSFPLLVFFFGALPWGSMIHKHTGRWI